MWLAGGNAKMNEFQAAMGLCNLRHLPEEIETRRVVSEIYDRLLTDVSVSDSGGAARRQQKPMHTIRCCLRAERHPGTRPSPPAGRRILRRKFFYRSPASSRAIAGTAGAVRWKRPKPSRRASYPRPYAGREAGEFRAVCEVLRFL